ncbi:MULTISPECIES: MFS transporter [Actinomyces]|uniref:MFS transporter n=1 Tax=Actinomyces respiraculi TaxID=2744574 RepID=A0A7T0PX60_9ACTO|nr:MULTISPECIES: MFS transporter [Actinomyces]QPL06143.1 MFS transporter [Actinomyces respiraculi]
MSASSATGTSRTSWRWAIAVVCALGLAINYIDRSAISVSLPYMTEDLHISETQQGLILSAFSWSYAVMQIPAGSLIDKFGERLMFGAAVFVWSLCTGLTFLANSFAVLFGLRLGLGIGEAGAYPAAAKTVSRWFPQRERARGTSVYDSGARIGSAVATPVIAGIIGLWGWHYVFLIAGILGILWAIGWWALYRRPEAFFGRVSDGELAHINEGREEEARLTAQASTDTAIPVRILLRKRAVWAMMIGFFCVNFAVTFFLTWFPTYLVDERGFDLLKLGVFGSIPPICAIVGSWCGGLVGDFLLGRGWSLTRTRKTCLVVGMVLTAFIGAAAAVPTAGMALTLMSISYFGSAFTIVTIWCLPGDFVPTSTVGVLGGTQNFFSNIGSALNPIVVGALYGATGAFGLPLLLSGVVCLVGACVFALMLPNVAQIDFSRDLTHAQGATA